MSSPSRISRRKVLRGTARGAAAVGLGGTFVWLLGRSQARGTVWQLDPGKCIQCGNCATNCVLKTSAVKCVHAFALCGYCDLCTGHFDPQPNARNSGAENQLCPTGAIRRTFVEDPYYQYTIDESKCVGCGKCVKGCAAFGNGSLFLQVLHGDMSFKEWLRSQGQMEMADDEDRRATLVGMHKRQKASGDFVTWVRSKTREELELYWPQGDQPGQDAGDLAWIHDGGIERVCGREGRRGEMLASYESQRGHIPRCLNCNQCSIATACPAGAYRRISSDRPYLLKTPRTKEGG